MSAFKNLSLYIPHVFPNFTKDYVATVFSNYGDVDHIDFVAKQDKHGKNYNAVYVHFKEWHDTQDNRNFQSELLAGDESRVYHDGPWYWIVLPNTAKKQISGNRKIRIDLGDINTVSAPPSTPVKENKVIQCPNAPKRMRTYADALSGGFANEPIATKLFDDFDDDFYDEVDEEVNDNVDDEIDREAEEFLNEMEETEAIMLQDIRQHDSHMVSVDIRYVQALERENAEMKIELAQLMHSIHYLNQMYIAGRTNTGKSI